VVQAVVVAMPVVATAVAMPVGAAEGMPVETLAAAGVMPAADFRAAVLTAAESRRAAKADMAAAPGRMAQGSGPAAPRMPSSRMTTISRAPAAVNARMTMMLRARAMLKEADKTRFASPAIMDGWKTVSRSARLTMTGIL